MATTFTHTAGAHTTAIHGDGALSFFSRFTKELTVSWRRARLREQLARMSARELMDIGIAEDELHRVYALEVFTPAKWAAQGVNLG